MSNMGGNLRNKAEAEYSVYPCKSFVLLAHRSHVSLSSYVTRNLWQSVG